MAPRSRGADAVQAAAAAQPAQAPATAPASAANPANEVSSKEGIVTFPLKGFTPMLDLKGMCGVRAGSREPIRSFRLLLLPEGKCVRVPHCPGQYIIVDGASWHCIDFPCWVVFNPNTKRNDELAVTCSDYLRSNPTMDMMTIESAMQPLRVRNNVFRHHELRITRMTDVSGFRPIAPTIDEVGVVSPWSEKFPLYNELGLGTYKEIVPKYINSQLRSRIQLCFEVATKHSRLEVDETGRHDKRAGDILLAENTGRLQHLKQQLCELPLEKYDEPLEYRIRAFNLVDSASLKTPERQQLLAGTAPRVPRTQMRARTLVLDEPEAPAAAPRIAPAVAPGVTAAAVDIDDDEFADPEEVDQELAKEAAGNSAAGSSQPKPLRRTERTRKKPAEEDKSKGNAAENGAAEVQINSRTGAPYKRGGPYNKQKAAPKRARAAQVIDLAANMSAAASATVQRSAPANDQRIEKLQTIIAELREEMAQLKTQNAALSGELELERKASELRVEAAAAKTAKEYMELMQKQFIQGLQTGYGMAKPAMHHPAPFSSGPPSARTNRSADESGCSSQPSSARMGHVFDDDHMPWPRSYQTFE